MDAEGVGQQRSLKYFQGLARGCWLVRWAWVDACAAAGRWLDEAPFELAGDHFALGAPHTGSIPMLLQWQCSCKVSASGVTDFWHCMLSFLIVSFLCNPLLRHPCWFIPRSASQVAGWSRGAVPGHVILDGPWLQGHRRLTPPAD